MARPTLANRSAYRIALIISAGFALLTVILGMLVYFAAHEQFHAEFEGRIADEAQALVAEYVEGGLPDLSASIRQREAGKAPDFFGFAVLDAKGRRLSGSMTARVTKSPWSDQIVSDPRIESTRARVLQVPLKGGLTLQVAGGTASIERIDMTILGMFGGGFLAVALAGTLGALVLGGYLDRRLAGINDAAQAIMAGDLARRIPIGPGVDEFDRLAGTLNAMLDRISFLLENLRQVSGDIAHDLRTPLANLRNRLEASLSEPPTPEEQQRVLADAITRVDEVLRLFSAILRISEVEGGKIRRSFVLLDLSALVSELCDSFAPAIEDGGRSLTSTVAPGVHLRGDRELLAQALINLIENAQLHTARGASIAVSLARDGDAACLSVADNGRGIAEADRARVLQRFVRLEASRLTPGHGLGLSLVKAIAELHGGSLQLRDAAPGLLAEIRLPGSPAKA